MKRTNLFDLSRKIAVITGAGGLLGKQHAHAISAFGGIPILTDSHEDKVLQVAKEIGNDAIVMKMDVTDESNVARVAKEIQSRFGKVDILINNAARNPAVDSTGQVIRSTRLEDLDFSAFDLDLAVGLRGAVMCAKHFGQMMANNGGGVIVNIASDLALIAPDQRLYAKSDVASEKQPVKPISYSVVKSGLLGLTRYLATYWANKSVRVNAICPGGVENGQPKDFIDKISNLVPLGRMAKVDEYQGIIVFLCSEASSYMTGSVISIDGGRTCW